MAYSVTRSAEFTGQLSQTVEYVHGTLCSPRAAKAIVDELDRQIRLISEHPLWFPIDQRMSDIFGMDIHRIFIRSYVAYYLVSDVSQTVHLITFRHQSQDISTYESFDSYES